MYNKQNFAPTSCTKMLNRVFSFLFSHIQDFSFKVVNSIGGVYCETRNMKNCKNNISYKRLQTLTSELRVCKQRERRNHTPAIDSINRSSNKVKCDKHLSIINSACDCITRVIFACNAFLMSNFPLLRKQMSRKRRIFRIT